jgi:hypothetical protein
MSYTALDDCLKSHRSTNKKYEHYQSNPDQ